MSAFKFAEEQPTVDAYNYMQMFKANNEEESPYTEHPDYTERKDGLLLAYDAYNGVGQFLNGKALDKFSIRESDDRYDDRRKQAYHVNVTKPLINFPINAIFSGEMTRPDLGEFTNVATAEYGGTNAFWKQATNESKLYGVSLIQLDRPEAGFMPNMQSQLDNPIKYSLINPVSVPDWKIEGNVFIWVKVIEEHPDSRNNFLNPGKFVPRLRVWTRDLVYVYDLDKDEKWFLSEATENPFGYVPIVPFYAGKPDKNSIYGSTSGIHLAYMNRRLYNQTSETDNQLRGTAFNILTIPTEDGEPRDVEIGASSVLFYDPMNAGEVRFVAPSSDPAKICMDRENQLIEGMYDAESVDKQLLRLPTATQVSYLSESAARSIRDLAFYGQQAEFTVTLMHLDMENMDIPAEMEIVWPMDYSQQVLTDNYVAKVIQLLSIVWPSETANKEFAKYLATHLIPLKDGKIEEILNEIESSDGVTRFDLSNQTELSGDNDE